MKGRKQFYNSYHLDTAEKNKTEVHVSLTQSASNPNEKTIEMSYYLMSVIIIVCKLPHVCNYLALFYAKKGNRK